jgi:hypothetical protein
MEKNRIVLMNGEQ